MFKAKINEKEFEIKPGKTPDTFILNGEDVKMDLIKIKDSSYHLIHNYNSYNIEVNETNYEEKIFEIGINGRNYTVQLKDDYDQLLHRLGMDTMSLPKVNDLHAPMPGLVVEIHVSEGQSVKQGEVLVTLEAMKMENILKAASDATVKKITIKKGAAVEKNELLIHLQ